MYTEEEATNKLCPTLTAGQFSADALALQNCIASDCMMWKWELIEKEKAKIAQEEAHGCMDVRELINSKTNGYCGLTK